MLRFRWITFDRFKVVNLSRFYRVNFIRPYWVNFTVFSSGDLRIYILLLNYIFGMREAGRPLIEFDIFDVENYDAIIERIEAQETERE